MSYVTNTYDIVYCTNHHSVMTHLYRFPGMLHSSSGDFGERIMRVAIIGSGVSGIGAAKVLIQCGYDVTVFERSQWIGGVWCAGYPDLHIQVAIILASIIFFFPHSPFFSFYSSSSESCSSISLFRLFMAIYPSSTSHRARSPPISESCCGALWN